MPSKGLERVGDGKGVHQIALTGGSPEWPFQPRRAFSLRAWQFIEAGALLSIDDHGSKQCRGFSRHVRQEDRLRFSGSSNLRQRSGSGGAEELKSETLWPFHTSTPT